jgi:large subunit ribosomal protein L17
LISDAIRYGPKNKEMMDMAAFWMLDKSLVHKLFKVLVPRFQNYQGAVTSMLNAPMLYPAPTKGRDYFPRAVLEFKGNPLPPIVPDDSLRNKNLIHNVLLDAAKKDFHHEKKEKQRIAEAEKNVE